MARNASQRRQESRYPALVAVLNRRREVFGLSDRELAERTFSRFGSAKNASQVYRILRGESGTPQAYAEQLAQVVDVGRHICRLLIEFEDALLPLDIGNAPPTRQEANDVIAAYEQDEDMFALQGAVELYERSMGQSDLVSLRIRADMSLLIGKLVRLHGKHPGFIDDALRFVDDAVNLYLGIEGGDGPETLGLEAALVQADLERATVHRRRGHLEMALRTIDGCRRVWPEVLATHTWLDGKCWHGLGDLYEQKSIVHARGPRAAEFAAKARDAYERALVAYGRSDADRTRVDSQAVTTDLAMLEIRDGDLAAAIARLDALAEEPNLPATVAARLDNRRAWALLAQGEIHRCQRYVKRAVQSATAAGDPLLMAMAEVLRYAFYSHLGMTKKANLQYEQVLDWVYRDGIRHAEVLAPLAVADEAVEDGGKGTTRLAWLMRVPWLSALLCLCVGAMANGCVAMSDGISTEHEAHAHVQMDGLAADNGTLASTHATSAQWSLGLLPQQEIEAAASDPKAPAASDPKHAASDPKQVSSDPKAPAASDPKHAASDPKAPAASDPKAPASSDPKAPASSDPKAPAASDPKAPASSDPKAPEASDPEETASDPKQPCGSDPKTPAASDPKQPADDTCSDPDIAEVA